MTKDSSEDAKDYRDSLFLPKTEFPMRAGLPKREPDVLKRWQAMDLESMLRADARDRELFILHDGPPYANGDIHIGTALNKILKDMVVKSRQMTGFNAPYVPGWDCHGLPIEWMVEERYRKKKLNKDEVPVVEFREECRKFAAEWIDVQREQFKRLGVIGDWDNPYTTMAHSAEAQIAREFMKFLMNGSLYRGAKPVMWSPVEKTALAEAEVEYMDHKSTSIEVRFPVLSAKSDDLSGASIVIWTTTPWTIPGNRALAYSAADNYAVYSVKEVSDGSLAVVGEKLVLAEPLADQVKQDAGIADWQYVTSVDTLEDVVCSHPLRGKGYDFDVPLLAGDFVTMDTGTGFVHIAPGHGADDYELGMKHGIEVPFTVSEGGTYHDDVPIFAGQHVYKADGFVTDALEAAGALLHKAEINHSYPHSWRSKAPLIFRNTPQWFVAMGEEGGLGETALREIDRVRWLPETSRNRIRSMVAERPDWLVSRQRSWGVPLTVFVNNASGEPLRDEAVNERIASAFEEEGADAWFTSDKSRFLGNEYDPEDYEQVSDILDVWFDSGSTQAFVLEARDGLQRPADLYLEGSDQHRGWFQSSLLVGAGTRGNAPYKAVLTHGFTNDADGRKMSKSLGNTIDPKEITEQQGADILRLWVATTEYTEDQRIGPEIISSVVDSYRKIRNTLRFLLGNLNGFTEAERISRDEMPELEQWMLHRLHEMDALVRQCVKDFDFHEMQVALFNFCTVDLSALYFDIRKDALYCDAIDAPRRRAARTVLDEVFTRLTTWFAPILVFTAEEVWLSRLGEGAGSDDSVHLQQFPETPDSWKSEELARRWDRVRDVRRVMTGALEIDRREKRIGASLEATATVYAEKASDVELLQGIDLAELSITSAANVVAGPAPDGAFTLGEVAGVAVVTGLANGGKCARCWQVLPEVSENDPEADICNRCSSAV